MYATIKNIKLQFEYRNIVIHIETIENEKYVDYYMNGNVRLDQYPKRTFTKFLSRNNLEIVEEFERVI